MASLKLMQLKLKNLISAVSGAAAEVSAARGMATTTPTVRLRERRTGTCQYRPQNADR